MIKCIFNKEYTDMNPTPKNYAMLSQDVYKETTSLSDKFHTIIDFDSASPDNEGYFGRAYVSIENRPMSKLCSVVFAHRGTDGISSFSDHDDNLRILLGRAPQQIEVAKNFIKDVVQKIEGEQKLIIIDTSHTGHSLGALVAQTLVAERCSVNYTESAIGFDSPGATESIKARGHVTQEFLRNTNRVNQLITIYNSAPNLINSCNTQVGTTHTFENVEGHSIDGIVSNGFDANGNAQVRRTPHRNINRTITDTQPSQGCSLL